MKPKSNAHRRERDTPTTAVLDASRWPERLVLLVDDVLTKNERYRIAKVGDHATIKESDLAEQFKEAVLAAAEVCAKHWPLFTGIRSGVWQIDVLVVWPRARHLDCTVPYGDSDSAPTMIRDAMQAAGILDDDVRIVVNRSVSAHAKGERRSVAVLTPVDPDALIIDLLDVEHASYAVSPPPDRSRECMCGVAVIRPNCPIHGVTHVE